MLYGYVINLDRHPERLFQFYQQKEAKYFQRVPAVDKKVLGILGDGNYVFDIETVNKYINRPITFGEIGCTLSHIKAWKLISENANLADNDFAIIAEDDVKFIENFEQSVTKLLANFTNNEIDLIILQKLGLYKEMHLFSNGELNYFSPQKRIECDNDGSSLYLLRKSKAKMLIKKLSQQKPFWLADSFSQFCDLNKITVLSSLFGYIPENSESDLEEDRKIARQK